MNRLKLALQLFSMLYILNCCTSKVEQKVHETAGNANLPEAKITFLELGSKKCIPCKQMQPVMASIDKRYGEDVEVIFYDVWREDQKHYAEAYQIRMIPTQIFLDASGNELFRHEGYFAEHDIDAFLQANGVSPVPGDLTL